MGARRTNRVPKGLRSAPLLQPSLGFNLDPVAGFLMRSEAVELFGSSSGPSHENAPAGLPLQGHRFERRARLRHEAKLIACCEALVNASVRPARASTWLCPRRPLWRRGSGGGQNEPI